MALSDYLYEVIMDDNKPVTDRTIAMSKLTALYLTDDVVEILSKIAKDPDLSAQFRQMASNRLFDR